MRRLVADILQAFTFDRPNLMKKTFHLLEELSYEGFVFPPDLMLFRKAIFTLEGVLHDLWPAFDMDAAVIRYLTALMVREFPMRIGGLLFPMADRPENYPSLISNSELQSLLMHPFADVWKTGAWTYTATLWYWSSFFGMPFAQSADSP